MPRVYPNKPASELANKAETHRKRVWGYLTLEEVEILDEAAERFGHSRSAMVGLLCRNAMFLTVSVPPLSGLSEAGRKIVEK